MSAWLASIGLEKQQVDLYGKALEDHQYFTLGDLLEDPPSKEDLKEYGIPPGRHLNRIINRLKDASGGGIDL